MPGTKAILGSDRKSYTADKTRYYRTNDIIIAVVLADVKLKGKTSSHLAKLGVAACKRMTRPFMEEMILKGLWVSFSENYEKVEAVFKQFA